eukprot:CAMPEP_0172201042 /NCGR_PEP_ID=MMETSP1050-20130122/29732_1 /TAXON_ID=233186 /ORGANISM="Cryptomonas curvata, Strain CCAP979/52" /LENGTH=41 /DNA_ID= /DNA_START= /DNA_END= /DNA_ORIENTATION=
MDMVGRGRAPYSDWVPNDAPGADLSAPREYFQPPYGGPPGA